MKLKRIMAVFLSAAMTATVVPSNVWAEDIVEDEAIEAVDVSEEEILQDEAIEEALDESSLIVDEAAGGDSSGEAVELSGGDVESAAPELFDAAAGDEIVIEGIEVASEEPAAAGEFAEETANGVIESQMYGAEAEPEVTADYGTVIATGDCGATEADNLIWTLYDKNEDNQSDVLVISGNGAMKGFSHYGEEAPWKQYIENNQIELVLGEGITDIGSDAFHGCNLVGTLFIPNSVNEIGYGAFYGCSGLTGDLIIPDNVLHLACSVFSGCSGFDGKLKLSNSLKALEGGAFYGCSGLKGDLIIPDSIKSIPDDHSDEGGTFENCSGFDGQLVLPKNIECIGYAAFSGCSNLSGELVIPESVKVIRSGAFNDCSGFTGDLVVPSNVTVVESCFKNCSGFDGKLVLPEGITEIYDEAFYGCRRLSGNLVLPKSLKNIYPRAFYKCSNLTGSLSVPETVDQIGEAAFFGCLNLNGTLDLPSSLSVVGEEAFWLTAFDKAIFRNENCDIYYSEKTIPETADIYGYNDSTAQEYAELFGRKFVADHSYEKSVIKESTCDSEGLAKCKCVICGDEYEEVLPAAEHKWNAAWTVDKAATCSGKGSQSIHCSVCNAIKAGSQTEIPMLSHKWGAWTQTLAPTVKAEGQEQRTCSLCGAKEIRAVAKRPLNLTAVKVNNAYVVSGDNIKVTWQAVPDADGYIVYRKTSKSWKRIATVKDGALSYVDQTTKIGTKYTYTVKAYADLGDRIVYGSSNKTGVTRTQKFYKEALKMKSATTVSTKSIKVRWYPRKKASGYTVFRRVPGKTWQKLGAVKGTTYTDKNCKSACAYQYMVKAYVKQGSKLIYSNYDKTGVTGVAKMLRPSFTVKSKTKRTATISWKKQSNVNGYVIYRKTGSDGTWTKIKAVNAKTSTYTDKKLKSRKTYYYIVKAYKKANRKIGIMKTRYSSYYTKKVKVK